MVNIVILLGGIAIMYVTYLFNGLDISQRKTQVRFAIEGLLLVALCLSLIAIPEGYTGVKVVNGQVKGDVMSTGFHLRNPIVENVYLVNNKEQNISLDDVAYGKTNEQAEVFFDDVTITYRIPEDKSAWVYANIANCEEELISQELIGSALEKSSKQSDDEIYSEKVADSAIHNMQASLDEKYGENAVVITNVDIGYCDAKENYNDYITAKKQNENQRNDSVARWTLLYNYMTSYWLLFR